MFANQNKIRRRDPSCHPSGATDCILAIVLGRFESFEHRVVGDGPAFTRR